MHGVPRGDERVELGDWDGLDGVWELQPDEDWNWDKQLLQCGAIEAGSDERVCVGIDDDSDSA